MLPDNKTLSIIIIYSTGIDQTLICGIRCTLIDVDCILETPPVYVFRERKHN